MTLSRKRFMEFTGLGLSAVVLAACAPKEVQTAVATIVSPIEPVVPRNTETPSAVPNATATQTIEPPRTPSATKKVEISARQMAQTQLPGSIRELNGRLNEFEVTPDQYKDPKGFRSVVENKMAGLTALGKLPTLKVAGMARNNGFISFMPKQGQGGAVVEGNIPMMVTPSQEPVLFTSVGLQDGNINMAVILRADNGYIGVEDMLHGLSGKQKVGLVGGPETEESSNPVEVNKLIRNGVHLGNFNTSDPANYTAVGVGVFMFPK